MAAPLPEADIDTDIIFPARFLLHMEKAGLGKHLFHERRHNRGKDQTPFILARRPSIARSSLSPGAISDPDRAVSTPSGRCSTSA